MEEKDRIETKIQEDLAIDETKLDEELQRQSARFFYYATLWSRATRKARIAKIKLDETEAGICRQYREEMAVNDPKTRVTEKMLDDFCAEHPVMKAAKEEWIEAEYLQDVLGVAKDAFWQRNQALVNLYKNKSEESFYANGGLEAMQEEVERRRERKSGFQKG